ncbi:hypothetical protein A9Q83_03045 [Alphaproteobacteria bacterium 46_93_T64]|nr:hypothetical protein A9Q83_03045 [Alphaproteobacteria bacterium 46_93_T64]
MKTKLKRSLSHSKFGREHKDGGLEAHMVLTVSPFILIVENILSFMNECCKGFYSNFVRIFEHLGSG